MNPTLLRRFTIFGLLILALLPQQTAVSAQSNVQLYLSQPDLSRFPQVSFTIRSADGEGVPLANYDALSIRENGVPISSFTQTAVPVGIDIVFVLDANDTYANVDDSGGLNRYQKAQESILQFATRFMNPNGRDRVTIIAPTADHIAGQTLVSQATSVAQIEAALNGYTPTFLPDVPLNRMMVSALTQLRNTQSDNRFQGILLLSDAGKLSQLNDAALVQEAQAQQISIFVAIMGLEATFEEIGEAADLYQPTRGIYVRMPNAQDTDPIYLVWQRQANQVRVVYESLQRENGRFPLTVTVGQFNAATEFELDLQPPTVELTLTRDVIRRAGTAVDTPLAELVPAFEPLPIQLTWPDNTPRPLAEIALLIDGQALPFDDVPDMPLTDANGSVQLEWPIGTLDAGVYELAVQVTDSLGKTAVSAPRLLTILTERPSPPTPTPRPSPTPTPAPLFSPSAVGNVPTTAWLGGLAILLIGGLALFLYRRPKKRRRSEPVTPKPAPPPVIQTHVAKTAVLKPLTANTPTIRLDKPNLALGRHPATNQIGLADKSVSPLHARIRKQDGQHWLYDEGSSSGTFLNHTKLGLSPQLLEVGDQIQVGRFIFAFQYRNPTIGEEE